MRPQGWNTLGSAETVPLFAAAPALRGGLRRSDRRKYVDQDDARGQECETKAKKARSVPIGFLTCDALLISFSHSRFSLQG
jgi:hypothetical protein